MHKQPRQLKILLTGGGTGGSVSVVLAVAEEIKKLKPKTDFLFVGTRKGPEKILAEGKGFRFVSIPAAKLRRYFSVKNFFDIFVFAAGLVRATIVVLKFRPDVIFNAGAFVGVPVCWTGKLFGAKIVIHQQDARIGLANKLIAPLAFKITTAFEPTSKDFYSSSGLFKSKEKDESRAEWVGNPVRQEFLDDKLPYKDFFGLHDKLPVLLVMGGATGAEQINHVMDEALLELVKSFQVIHITGSGKKAPLFSDPNYHQYEFLSNELPTAMKLANYVISRAGLGTLAELSALGKPAIIAPMPFSHQEDNGVILDITTAAVVLYREQFTAKNVKLILHKLKFDQKVQEMMKKHMAALMPKDASGKLAKIIIKAGNHSAKGEDHGGK
jgi:UDP-N-acetylglucosamine--N-acetylmuramyl-(pentapeptide) pyrophosphoryl-undecaprenol N-acetylglucosamine transferase